MPPPLSSSNHPHQRYANLHEDARRVPHDSHRCWNHHYPRNMVVDGNAQHLRNPFSHGSHTHTHVMMKTNKIHCSKRLERGTAQRGVSPRVNTGRNPNQHQTLQYVAPIRTFSSSQASASGSHSRDSSLSNPQHNAPETLSHLLMTRLFPSNHRTAEELALLEIDLLQNITRLFNKDDFALNTHTYDANQLRCAQLAIYNLFHLHFIREKIIQLSKVCAQQQQRQRLNPVQSAITVKNNIFLYSSSSPTVFDHEHQQSDLFTLTSNGVLQLSPRFLHDRLGIRIDHDSLVANQHRVNLSLTTVNDLFDKCVSMCLAPAIHHLVTAIDQTYFHGLLSTVMKFTSTPSTLKIFTPEKGNDDKHSTRDPPQQPPSSPLLAPQTIITECELEDQDRRGVQTVKEHQDRSLQQKEKDTSALQLSYRILGINRLTDTESSHATSQSAGHPTQSSVELPPKASFLLVDDTDTDTATQAPHALTSTPQSKMSADMNNYIRHTRVFPLPVDTDVGLSDRNPPLLGLLTWDLFTPRSSGTPGVERIATTSQNTPSAPKLPTSSAEDVASKYGHKDHDLGRGASIQNDLIQKRHSDRLHQQQVQRILEASDTKPLRPIVELLTSADHAARSMATFSASYSSVVPKLRMANTYASTSDPSAFSHGTHQSHTKSPTRLLSSPDTAIPRPGASIKPLQDMQSIPVKRRVRRSSNDASGAVNTVALVDKPPRTQPKIQSSRRARSRQLHKMSRTRDGFVEFSLLPPLLGVHPTRLEVKGPSWLSARVERTDNSSQHHPSSPLATHPSHLPTRPLTFQCVLDSLKRDFRPPSNVHPQQQGALLQTPQLAASDAQRDAINNQYFQYYPVKPAFTLSVSNKSVVSLIENHQLLSAVTISHMNQTLQSSSNIHKDIIRTEYSHHQYQPQDSHGKGSALGSHSISDLNRGTSYQPSIIDDIILSSAKYFHDLYVLPSNHHQTIQSKDINNKKPDKSKGRKQHQRSTHAKHDSRPKSTSTSPSKHTLFTTNWDGHMALDTLPLVVLNLNTLLSEAVMALDMYTAITTNKASPTKKRGTPQQLLPLAGPPSALCLEDAYNSLLTQYQRTIHDAPMGLFKTRDPSASTRRAPPVHNSLEDPHVTPSKTASQRAVNSLFAMSSTRETDETSGKSKASAPRTTPKVHVQGLDIHSTMQGLTTILQHELLHAAIFINSPNLWTNYNSNPVYSSPAKTKAAPTTRKTTKKGAHGARDLSFFEYFSSFTGLPSLDTLLPGSVSQHKEQPAARRPSVTRGMKEQLDILIMRYHQASQSLHGAAPYEPSDILQDLNKVMLQMHHNKTTPDSNIYEDGKPTQHMNTISASSAQKQQPQQETGINPTNDGPLYPASDWKWYGNILPSLLKSKTPTRFWIKTHKNNDIYTYSSANATHTPFICTSDDEHTTPPSETTPIRAKDQRSQAAYFTRTYISTLQDGHSPPFKLLAKNLFGHSKIYVNLVDPDRNNHSAD